MTQTHILKGKKLNRKELADSTRRMVQASVVGGRIVFQKKQYVLGQWYVQKKDVGHYRVMHNIGTTQYGVATSAAGLSIETKDLTDVGFDVFIKKDGEPHDADFHFAMNFPT